MSDRACSGGPGGTAASAAFGSIAGSARLDPNHLKLAGWHPGETWGNEVAQFDYLLADGKPTTFAQLHEPRRRARRRQAGPARER